MCLTVLIFNSLNSIISIINRNPDNIIEANRNTNNDPVYSNPTLNTNEPAIHGGLIGVHFILYLIAMPTSRNLRYLYNKVSINVCH